MITHNLFKIFIEVNKFEDVERALVDNLSDYESIFSYIVYNNIATWVISCLISDENAYNTITVDSVIDEVLLATDHDETPRVVCYKQPSIDLLIELYEPLVLSLAREQRDYWKQIEYEDLCQMCRLCICILYNRGYYVHKSIIRRAFSNYVLQQLRHDRYKPITMSIDDKIGENDDKEKITIGDIIPDNSLVDELKEEAEEEALKQIYDEAKAIVVGIIGPRQWDQLVRDYKFKHTTTQSRAMMFRIKNELASKGITLNKLIEKYGG